MIRSRRQSHNTSNYSKQFYSDDDDENNKTFTEDEIHLLEDELKRLRQRKKQLLQQQDAKEEKTRLSTVHLFRRFQEVDKKYEKRMQQLENKYTKKEDNKKLESMVEFDMDGKVYFPKGMTEAQRRRFMKKHEIRMDEDFGELEDEVEDEEEEEEEEDEEVEDEEMDEEEEEEEEEEVLKPVQQPQQAPPMTNRRRSSNESLLNEPMLKKRKLESDSRPSSSMSMIVNLEEGEAEMVRYSAWDALVADGEISEFKLTGKKKRTSSTFMGTPIDKIESGEFTLFEAWKKSFEIFPQHVADTFDANYRRYLASNKKQFRDFKAGYIDSKK